MKAIRTGLLLAGCCSVLYSAGTLAEALTEDWLVSGVAVSSSELNDSRGKQDLQINLDELHMLVQQNDGEQAAVLENNTLNAGVNGANYIHTGAMNGLTGIATVIQNTGNQVIIQDTTMVNVTISP